MRNVQLQIIRGVLANMPSLGDGEFYFATDKCQLYIGFGGNNLPIGGTMSVQIADKTNTSQLLAVQSDGSILSNTGVNKSLVLKTGSLVTTSVTANQSILSYTVTAAKTFYLTYFDLQGRFTTASATASNLGTVSVSIGGVIVYQAGFNNPTTSDCGSQSVRIYTNAAIPIAAGTVILIEVTPAAVTSMTWLGNLGGYEQ